MVLYFKDKREANLNDEISILMCSRRPSNDRYYKEFRNKSYNNVNNMFNELENYELKDKSNYYEDLENI